MESYKVCSFQDAIADSTSNVNDFENIYDGVVERSAAFATLKKLVAMKKVQIADAEHLQNSYRTMYENMIKTKRKVLDLKRRIESLEAMEHSEIENISAANKRLEILQSNLDNLEVAKDHVLDELGKAEQQNDVLQVEVFNLTSERQKLRNNLEEQMAKEERLLRPHIDKLTAQKVSIVREMESISASETRGNEQKQILLDRLKSMEITKKELQDSVSRANSIFITLKLVPERTRKSADHVKHAVQALQTESEKVNTRLADSASEILHMQTKRDEAEGLKKSLAAKLELHRESIAHRESDVASVQSNLEKEKDRFHQLATERVEIELNYREADEEVRQENRALEILRKEHRFAIKKMEKLKFILNDANQSIIPSLKEHLLSIKKDLESRVNENKALEKESEILRQEVDVGLARVLIQEGSESSKQESFRALIGEVNALEAEVYVWEKEEKMQSKVIAVLTEQIKFKALEILKLRSSEQEVKAKVRIKQLEIDELVKQYSEVTRRIADFDLLFNAVNMERNKLANLILLTKQTAAEMHDKIEILENEVEIMQSESCKKNRELQREKESLQQCQNQKISMRLECNHVQDQYGKTQVEIRQQINEIERLNSIINNLERDILQLKQMYEVSVEGRNFSGVQLIDRNDELCILYEKSNIIEHTAKVGKAAINAKEGDIRVLTLQRDELQRRVGAAKKTQSNAFLYDETIASLQNQIVEQKEFSNRLGKNLEDPCNSNRWRDLGGEDPDEANLASKIALLEARLSEKKEILLERELVLEEIESHTQSLEEMRVEDSSSNSTHISVSQRMSSLHFRAHCSLKSMMATASELSMYEATAVQLRQEKSALDKAFKEGNDRFNSGEAPSCEAEKEWLRRRKFLITDDRDLIEKEEVEKVPQRPTAYLPDGTGIAKPYGGMPPFKPHEPESVGRLKLMCK